MNDRQQNKNGYEKVRRLVEAKEDDVAKRREAILVTRNERDSLLESAVLFGLSVTEIVSYSQSWNVAFRSRQHVESRIVRLGKKTDYKRRDRKRVGTHNQSIHKTFMRLAGQLMGYGYSIDNLTRETKVWDDNPVRPDYSFIAEREKKLRFLVEIQASKSKHTLWRKKLRQFVKLYEDWGELFKVLIIVHSPDELTRAKEGARAALEKHPKLNLFLFALIVDIERGKSDVVGAPIWECAWRGMKPGPLVR